MKNHWSRFAGGAVFLAVALAAAACGGRLSDNPSPSQPSAASAPDQPADIGGGAREAAVERKVVVNTSLELQVTKVPQTYVEIARLARSAGGFVANSTVTGDETTGSATVRLRVPASRHDEVAGQLRSLASKVVRESTNAKEVTDEYTDLQSRVRNLQRNEAQYQSLLSQAKTLDEILNINSRLESVRGQIEQTQGRIALLDDLTDFATISVSMSTPPVSASGKSATPVEVLAGAWRVSRDIAVVLANLAIILAVVAAWTLPFALLGLGSWRLGRRLSPAVRRLLG